MKKTGLKYTPRLRSGYSLIVSPRNAPLRMLECGVVRLARGQSMNLSAAGKEMVLTLLGGRCRVEGAGQKLQLGPRKSVFDEWPWAVYSRGIDRLTLTARSNLEVLVSAAPIPSRKPLLELLPPGSVVERVAGSGTYERRVRTIVGEDFPAHRLLVGETINEAGKWSSYPPHRHEKNSPARESKLEEIYYYKLEKAHGFGVQRIYTDNRRIDEIYVVHDGDLCALPRGYHPVAAAPSSRLYYFWALAGRNRKMNVRTDPDYM